MQLNVGKEVAAMERDGRSPSCGIATRKCSARRPTPATNNGCSRRSSGDCNRMAEGDLSERARARAMEIASDADIRRRPPKAPIPKPDAPQSPPIPVSAIPAIGCRFRARTITREYKGRLLEVLVLDEGFEYAGEKFKSLSGVAKRITGSHCNGYLFFNLKRGGDQ